MRHNVRILGTIVVVVMMALLVPLACAPQPHDLSFETVVKEGGGGANSQQIKHPLLKVAVNAKEMAELKALTDQRGHITDTGTVEWSFDKHLDEVDFRFYFVVAAFRGYTPYVESIEIVALKQVGGTVYVIANFVTQPPGHPRLPEVSSPYHIVKVKRGDLEPAGKITFILVHVAPGVEVTRLIHTVQ